MRPSTAMFKWTLRRRCNGTTAMLITASILVLFVIFIACTRNSIACFDKHVVDGVPDILDDVQPPAKGKSIFFHETSCSVLFETALSINARQACAVESAARLNPNMTVYLLFAAPIKYEEDSSLFSDDATIIKQLFKYPNVRIKRVDLNRYTVNTPLEDWYRTGELQRSKYANSHASDVLRYLSLWKFGGTYMDLDIVLMKSLSALDVNYAAAESNTDIAAGILNFDHKGVGHEIASSCIREIQNNFKGGDWGHNGPGVITRVLKHTCKTKHVKDMTMDSCKGFNVLPPSSFYPIPWKNWSMYFDAEKLDKALDLTKSSYAIHVWNKFSINTHIYKHKSEVAYGVIAKKFCPNVFSASGNTF